MTGKRLLTKKTIELHAPTSSTQKLKLMGRGGQFTYIPTIINAQGAEWTTTN